MNNTAAQVAYFMRPMGLDAIRTIALWLGNLYDIAVFYRNMPVPIGPEAVLESWKPAPNIPILRRLTLRLPKQIC